jgi:hypothetical protein
MAYDADLADRIRALLGGQSEVTEEKIALEMLASVG